MASRETLKGKAHKFGDNVNTDLILPATYLISNDPVELGRHLMEGHDPEFVNRVEPGDIIVGGENFGSGSSREHAPLAIKGGGMSCVIAGSYARIFYRNAINVGLPLIEAPEAVVAIDDGDQLKVDLDAGRIDDLTKGETFTIAKYPEFMQRIMDAGGLIEYVRKQS
ncbi:MAG: 3-isopropylmalate dehydratase small subunit [Candidatus Anoxymicrobium japonicum]|uniref:3-isopropylmalate dehydratase small subunit n=1 Tax=Candidatus Anoxymicrobium japonicum TaxID=2013648 RepID=A0A2N3G728_9ACTN|nr:MAG: 3-isopropylmalate dehydratase small subunit [Candidatus Anoxymicrobium japonicum]